MDQAPGWGADHNVFAAAKEGRAGPRPPSPPLYYLPRDEAFKRYVDQWLHIAEQSGLLRQRMEHWLEYRWPTAHGK